KESSAGCTSRTAMSSGKSAFTLCSNRRRSTSGCESATAATCPRACTPASVRPAPRTRTGARRTTLNARSSSPWTVGPPGWSCPPRKRVPSYSTTSRSCTLAVLSGGDPASQMIPHQQLRDLDGVERRTLPHVVERHPEREPVLGGRVGPDAAHVRRGGPRDLD